jgi:predicted O-linked N-acetylglucosamine transferase (SPINDLY family)
MATPPRRPPTPPFQPWGAKPGAFDQALAAHQQGRLADAQALYAKVPPTDPRHATALHHRGLIDIVGGHLEQARALIQQSVRLNPRDAHAWSNLAHVLNELQLPDDALAACDAALALDARHASAWNNKGNALRAKREFHPAIECLDRAVALAPQMAAAWANRGLVLRELGLLDLALASFERAVQCDPRNPKAWADHGSAHFQQGRHEQALQSFQAALAIDPHERTASALAMECMQRIGHWDGLARRWQQELDLATTTGTIEFGLPMLTHPTLSAQQLHIGLRKMVDKHFGAIQAAPFGHRRPSDRLRIAYLSPDFRDHPLALLMAGVFERHDRQRFEVTAVAYKPMPATPRGRRLFNAFDRVVDVAGQEDEPVVAQLRALNIDIAIDLAGHTSGHRLGIFARRCAPIQVNYLGYPGTMGAPFIDYIVGDRWVSPLAQAQDFSEKIVLMPECFQANDDLRQIDPETPSRAALGLPESGFVFCCLNNTYKITPMAFDVWMRLLAQVPGSVLWLLGETPTVVRNLQAAAAARGIAPQRLVFAQRRPYEQYLAQYRQADLFLDTLPFNAGTTASDALWAGLPVLTQLGQTFAGRMAASLLDTLGLPELIARSAQEYEQLALRLATEPGWLQALRARLAQQVVRSPLFDTARFTRHLEAAFEAMWQRHAQGLPPDHIPVQALPGAALSAPAAPPAAR